MRRTGHPAVGQRTVGIRQRPEIDFRRTERKRKPVVIDFVRERQAEPHQTRVERFQARQQQRAHRRHVEAAGQCRAHVHPAPEMPVVVLRHILSRGRGQCDRTVVQYRSGGQDALFQCERVQKGLERGAGLTRRAYAVDETLPRRAPAADIGPHRTAGVVEHQHRAVLHVAVLQLRELRIQHPLHVTLQGGVERGAHDRTRFQSELCGQMRRVGDHAGLCMSAGDCGFRQAPQSRAARGVGRRIAAGARGDPRRIRLRRGQQRRQQHGLIVRQRIRALAEKRRGRGRHAAQLAAKRREIEVGLQDLRLAQAPLQIPGGPHLTELAPHRFVRARGEGGIEKTRELHRQRARAAPPFAPEVLPRGVQQRAQVDAAVRLETPVLVFHHFGTQRRGNRVQRLPGCLPVAEFDAHFLQRYAGPVQQPGGRRRMRALDRFEIRRVATGRQRQAGDGGPDERLHGITTQSAFGSSPNCSGWYIASTRVGGRRNVPGVLSRTT